MPGNRMSLAAPHPPQRDRRGLWDQLVDCICRPPRDEYSLDELIGGARGKFTIDQRRFRREDLVLTNKHGQRLQCSHYKSRGPADKRPCVVYAHCNSGSRRDAEEALYVLLPHNITVFCLDFAGSGLSDGEWVTLGAHEVDDLEAAVAHLRAARQTTTIGLWGRSMGAVTAMAYARQDPSVCGIVVDSPFSKLTDLMTELVVEQKLPIPRPFMRVALSMMRRSVRKRAHFSIDDVAPLDYVGETFVPALFGHATEDTFVGKHHSERLMAAYAGDKNFITFRGDHNSVRPNFFYSSVLIFFHNVLQCPDELPEIPTPRHARAAVRSQLSRQSLGMSSDDASAASVGTPVASTAAAAPLVTSPTAASVSSGSSPVALPQCSSPFSPLPAELLPAAAEPVLNARANSFRRGSLASESATSDGGSSAHSFGLIGSGGRPLSPNLPLDSVSPDATFSRLSGRSADTPAPTTAEAAGDDDADLQRALEASLQEQRQRSTPPRSPPPASRSPKQPQSPEQLADLILQRLPAQTGPGPPPEAVSNDLGISVEDVEASMVAAAIKLSLQDAGGSQHAGPTGPPSLKMLATAAQYQRGGSGGGNGGNSGNGSIGSSGSGNDSPLRQRPPLRSKSTGARSILGRLGRSSGGSNNGGSTGSGGGDDRGGLPPAQDLPPILGHVSGSLRVSPAPTPTAHSRGSSGGGGFGDIGAPLWEPPAGSTEGQKLPFAPAFEARAANDGMAPLPVKATADARQNASHYGSGSGNDSEGGTLQPGDHVGLTHVELGCVSGQDRRPADNASSRTAGRSKQEAGTGFLGSNSGSGRGHAGGSNVGSATDNTSRWTAGRPADSGETRQSGSGGSGSTSGLPSQARPWWADDGSPSMQCLPSSSTSAIGGSLEISRSERSAAERAGLQRAVFGSADGLTFYTAMAAGDGGSQRRTGSDGGLDDGSQPQQPGKQQKLRAASTDSTASSSGSVDSGPDGGATASEGGASTRAEHPSPGPQSPCSTPKVGRNSDDSAEPSPQRPARPSVGSPGWRSSDGGGGGSSVDAASPQRPARPPAYAAGSRR